MSTGDFLNLHPSELKFPFELKKQNSCSFQLTNITDQDIAFKVKTTDPKKYCVRPNTGIILPRSVCGVTVTKQAQKETPSNTECKDKFLVQAVVAPSGTTVKDITADMFNKEDKKVVEECKLRVVYIPASPHSPVLEEGSSPRAEHGSQSSSRPDVLIRPDRFGVMSTGDFLNLGPSELKFPFELMKQISCSFQLTNKTDQYIAFKVKTTNPKKYCVRPNYGIVLPSYCDVTVTMQAQKEAPPNMECKDKFLVQAIVAPHGAIVKDIIADMFNKEDEKVVEECKLRVVYVLANPRSPVPEESEEWFSAMAEHGSQSSSRLDVLIQPTRFGVMSTEDFLNLHPSELIFPFEMKKQISCSFQLTNITDQFIAFKVKTTNPKKYCVRPNHGIVLPRSFCDVTVTMQAQKEAPPNMQCIDKFPLQAVVVPNGSTINDIITADMFNKEENKVVEECKLVERRSQSSSRPDVATRSGEPNEKHSKEALLGKEVVIIRSGGYPILFLVLIGMMISFVAGYLIKQQPQQYKTCGLDIHFRCNIP